MTTAAVVDRARRVQLLVLDVDGVLTDGRIYLTERGEELKVFDVRDGSGIVAVRADGTRREVVMRAIELLAESKGRVLGAVLTERKHVIPSAIYKRI